MVAYKEQLEKIEWFNQFLCITLYMTYTVIFVMIAPYSFVRYYNFGMREDSFYLFLPAWFVFIVKWNEFDEHRGWEKCWIVLSI